MKLLNLGRKFVFVVKCHLILVGAITHHVGGKSKKKKIYIFYYPKHILGGGGSKREVRLENKNNQNFPHPVSFSDVSIIIQTALNFECSAHKCGQFFFLVVLGRVWGIKRSLCVDNILPHLCVF